MYYWLSPEPNTNTTLHTSDYQAVEDFRLSVNNQEIGVNTGAIFSYGQLSSGEKYLLNDYSFNTQRPLNEFNAFKVPKVFPDSWLTLNLFRHDRRQTGSYKNSNIPSTASINELRNITLSGNLEEGVTVSTTGSFTEAVIIWNHESKESPNSD